MILNEKTGLAEELGVEKGEAKFIDGKWYYNEHRSGKLLFHTRSDGSLDISTINEQPSMTQQQFKDECDINNIMKDYQETGTINHRNPNPGVYSDMTQIKDLQGALRDIQIAENAFMALPAKVRSRFENDPVKFVEFCQDSKNQEEAVALGIADPKIVTKTNDKLNDDKNTTTQGSSQTATS